MPFGGAAEALAIIVFGGLFLFAGARAYVAIRRGNPALHREWMIRMFALALGIATVRLTDLVLVLGTRAAVRETFVASLWIGWLLTLAVAEAWIRFTRRGGRTAETAAAGATSGVQQRATAL